MKKLIGLAVAVGDTILLVVIMAGAMFWGETPTGAKKIAIRVMHD